MIIYSYTPERGDKISNILIYSLAGVGLILAIIAEIIPSAASALHVAAFALILGSILVWSRCMLSFTYSIESNEDGKAPDLVVRENKGKTSRILSRVSLDGARLIKSDSFKPDGAPVFDHRPSIFIKNYWIFEVSERETRAFIRFSPDEEMIRILRSAGIGVVE